MTDTVRQLHEPLRDVFGRVQASRYTRHCARVVISPGKTLGPASRQGSADAAAIVWLIDHPHPVTIGGKFELPEAGELVVARFERRQLPDGVLHKVYFT